MKSHRGTQFRIWATQRLREYLVKGFTMDDERLKNPPGKGHKDYFDEQLERIRDIRSSERRFYQKVLDIYATSVDYTPNTALSQQFFATVQNKMHWAVHGQTAAEVIHARADASQPLMGLKSTRPGGIVRREDVAIAKNYLNEAELHALNRIVNAYIEFAELQALSRRVMTMRDWVEKLDDFLELSDRELLHHAGKITAEAAKAKAESEYDRYRALMDAQPLPVDADFEKAVKQLLPRPSRAAQNPARAKSHDPAALNPSTLNLQLSSNELPPLSQIQGQRRGMAGPGAGALGVFRFVIALATYSMDLRQRKSTK